MAGWIKMPLAMEVGLGPGDFPLPKKGSEPPIFGPCLLWPNGWMDEEANVASVFPASSAIECAVHDAM